MTDTAPLRFGILGAARIAPMALVAPARRVPEAAVTAIAARDVAKVHDCYDALLADPSIDAVYNPLPNGLHCEWTIRALRAGKHVLCEKPIASNEGEAARMAEAARETGRALVEAFHWRYHPLAARMQAILASGAIGALRHYEAWFAIPLVMRGDIRWRLDLAGGALMDTGCYPISLVRHLAGAEPEVVSAKVLLRAPDLDRRAEAELRFADGRTAKIGCSMWSSTLLRVALRVTGERGEMRVINPLAPHLWHRLRVTSPDGTTAERVAGASTYTHQLRAFVDHVRSGTPVPTGPEDGVANMRVIDAIYRAAGLRPRGA